MRSVSATIYAIVGAGLIAMSYGLARFAFGLYLPAIRRDLGLSPEAAGVVAAMAFVGFSVASLFAAAVSASLGARRTAVLASLFGLAGLMSISYATGAWTLAAGVFACGVCTGLMMPALTAGMQSAVRSLVHGRVSAVMNAGTSIGVVVSVPAVVLMADRWREAYLGFAAVAVLCVLAAWRFVPPLARAGAAPSMSTGVLAGRRVQLARLVAFGLGMGFVSSAYWVFAPDLVVSSGGLDSSITGWMWLTLGVAGLGGAAAGDLADRFGVSRTQGAAFAFLSFSLVLLAACSRSASLAVVSAALFGLAYMMLTGIYLMVGVRLLPRRQSLGAVIPFLAIAVGQALGSPATGALVAALGHAGAFFLMASLGALFALVYRGFPEARNG